LHGLLRIRGFTQDDSHIFCTEEQAPGEIKGLLAFVISVLRAFGFEDFEAMLSTREVGKSIGTDEGWETATASLRAALVAENIPFKVDEGGAAFYGPKIDVKVRDAIGRSWQLSTIQYDFNLPDRFELEYNGADGAKHRPVMLHRALFGSVERFFGVLVEHFAGAFPTWMAPVQARILPVAEAHDAYAHQLADSLMAQGYRVDVIEATEQLGKRIRTAKIEKIPYVLVVGDDDIAANTVGLNPRGGDVERGVSVADFTARLAADVAVAAIAR
jgi:threonyl-tRNA synthetase